MEHNNVSYDGAGTVYQMANYVEPDILTIRLVLPNCSHRLHTNNVYHKTMPQSVKHPFHKHGFAVTLAFESEFVEEWYLHEDFLGVLEVKESKVHDRERGHCDVVHLINDGLVKRLPTESREETEVVLHGNVKHILVEVIQHKQRIPSVSFSSMYEHKRLQKLKLSNGIISTSSGLLALFSQNTNSNMRLKDHVDVIGAITDGQSDFLRETLPDHVYDISFLFWGDSASENDINLIGSR